MLPWRCTPTDMPDSLTAWIIGHDGWAMELGRDGQLGGHASGSQ